MKFLITGGAGFIGSHLTGALLQRGDAVTVADNFSTGSRANLVHLAGNPALNVVELDVVSNAAELDALVRDADVVIHLAAAVGVDLVVKDPCRTISTNVHGTENVMTPAARYGKRIIIASTSEVYGKSSAGMFRESDDLLIGSPCNSRWSYACSKLLDEFYLMAFHQAAGLPGTVVRFFNTVGPRQSGRYGMVVPRFVASALNNEPIRIFGDGEQSRCFCHVLDVVNALLLILDSPATVGEIYNIGSQRLVTIRELAELIRKRLNSSSELEFVPYEIAYAKGFEDMRRRMPDTAKIRDLLGWTPRRSLEEIIDDVAASMKGTLNK